MVPSMVIARSWCATIAASRMSLEKGHTLASQAESSTADTVLKGVTLKSPGLKGDDVNILGISP